MDQINLTTYFFDVQIFHQVHFYGAAIVLFFDHLIINVAIRDKNTCFFRCLEGKKNTKLCSNCSNSEKDKKEQKHEEKKGKKTMKTVNKILKISMYLEILTFKTCYIIPYDQRRGESSWNQNQEDLSCYCPLPLVDLLIC